MKIESDKPEEVNTENKRSTLVLKKKINTGTLKLQTNVIDKLQPNDLKPEIKVDAKAKSEIKIIKEQSTILEKENKEDLENQDIQNIQSANLQAIRKKPKKWISREDYDSLLEIMKKEFPKLFGEEIKLLKVGISKDIAEKLKPYEISSKKLAGFFNVYCKTKQYLKLAIKEGAKRCNIEGEEIEEVTEEHVENAKLILKQINSKFNKKQEAKRDKGKNSEIVSS